MKILLASSSSGSRGGGELYLLYLARALRERGHEVMLWASSHPRMDELAAAFRPLGEVRRAAYANTYDLPGRSLAAFFRVSTARRIAAEWCNSGADIIHLNKQNLEDGLDLLSAARRSGLPTLCTVHLTQDAQYLRARFARIRDWVARRALRAYPGLLVAVLEKRQRDLAAFVGAAGRLHWVPNGVPMPDLSARENARRRRSEFGIAPDELLIVGVGRMVPQKRPLVFLEHAREILRTVPLARFLWVGDGPLDGVWDEWIGAQQLAARIHRLPWQQDVVSLLLAADVFLHTAEFEGLPLAILEAMSAALPCAITPNLLAEMPFLDSSNSLAIDPGGAWIARLREREQLRTLGAAARSLAEREFSFATLGARYEALYRQCLPTTH